jgi:hypothetical protein
MKSSEGSDGQWLGVSVPMCACMYVRTCSTCSFPLEILRLIDTDTLDNHMSGRAQSPATVTGDGKRETGHGRLQGIIDFWSGSSCGQSRLPTSIPGPRPADGLCDCSWVGTGWSEVFVLACIPSANKYPRNTASAGHLYTRIHLHTLHTYTRIRTRIRIHIHIHTYTRRHQHKYIQIYIFEISFYPGHCSQDLHLQPSAWSMTQDQ